MRFVAIVMVLGACGRFGFSDGDNTTSDGAPTDDPDGGGSGSDSDSVTGDGPVMDAPQPPCLGTTHLLTDNFNDGVYDATAWGRAFSDTGTSYSEVAGHLVIQLPTNMSDRWAGYWTTSTYDFHDDRVFVQAIKVPNGNANAVLQLFTSTARTDGESIESEAGNVWFRRRASGSIIDLGNVAYGSATQWWQIRELAGTTYWQTSGDGLNWTTRYMMATVGGTQRFVVLSGGTNNAQATPGSVELDNYNGGGAPPNCP